MTHPLKLCTTKELRSVYGIMYCRQQLWRLEKFGKFPKRVQVGIRQIGYLSSKSRHGCKASSIGPNRELPLDETEGRRPPLQKANSAAFFFGYRS